MQSLLRRMLPASVQEQFSPYHNQPVRQQPFPKKRTAPTSVPSAYSLRLLTLLLRHSEQHAEIRSRWKPSTVLPLRHHTQTVFLQQSLRQLRQQQRSCGPFRQRSQRHSLPVSERYLRHSWHLPLRHKQYRQPFCRQQPDYKLKLRLNNPCLPVPAP